MNLVTEKYIHYLKLRRFIVFSLFLVCFILPTIHSDNQSRKFDQLQSFLIITKDFISNETISQLYFNYYTNAFNDDETSTDSTLSTPAYLPDSIENIDYSKAFEEQELYHRVHVSDTTLPPFSFIGQIITAWDSDEDGAVDTYEYCSGFMEGPDIMITAGHCVYDSRSGGWATSLVYFPAKNGRTNQYPPMSATAISLSETYILKESADEDWALVKLDMRIGLETGWFGKGWSPSSLNNLMVAVTGYPTDKAYGEMWSSKGKITSTLTSRLKYDMETYFGESGSPLYDSSGVVWGIHTRGSDFFAGNSSGTKITEELYNFLEIQYLYSILYR